MARRRRTGIIEVISQQLHLMYEAIIAQGVPDRLAEILTTPDGDRAALEAGAAGSP
jgi:hypothetical protein